MDFEADSLVLYWVALTSSVGFAAMGLDKLLARGGFSRIRERTLWLVALVGGFVGIIFGGMVFHHKTSKLEFWGPVFVSAVLWTAFLFFESPLSGWTRL